MSKPQLYANLPQELYEADEILRRYGRWARGGGRGAARCGSAEGNYRAPQDEEDRQPSEPVMMVADVERARQALRNLPMMTLLVIQWLYVKPEGMHTKMRDHGIQPRHMRERHLEGVTLFWSGWKKAQPCDKKQAVALSSRLDYNLVT